MRIMSRVIYTGTGLSLFCKLNRQNSSNVLMQTDAYFQQKLEVSNISTYRSNTIISVVIEFMLTPTSSMDAVGPK